MKTTLLITTYNRGHLIEKTLERLTHLTIPDEILIVDDGSNKQQDATEHIAIGFSQRLPIKYIYNNNPEWTICSYARNIGIKHAIGDIIITSEPELLWVTDIVSQMLAAHMKFPNHVISVGTIYHAQVNAKVTDEAITNPRKFLNNAIVEDYEIQPRAYNQDGFCKTENLTATFCALYEKEWIMQVGGWDEGFTGAWGWDDTDLLTRLRIRGYNQIIDNNMEAIHQFHPHLPPHIMGEGSKKNEDYLIAKRLNEVTDSLDPRLIANNGKEWGIVKK